VRRMKEDWLERTEAQEADRRSLAKAEEFSSN
jgi:hypothetical protein